MKDTIQASLIISTYNNTPFLKAVLSSLQWQTKQNFEVIVSEDAQQPETAQLLADYPIVQPLQHISQPDEGWRKEAALNRAIEAASSDWLIFIDGDCVLHPRFIESHLKWASPDAVLAGKRVKLTESISKRLLLGEINAPDMPRILRRKLFQGGGGMSHLEDGFYFSPDSMLGRLFSGRANHSLTGSNMSCSRHALRQINGFDEDYTSPAIGEDVDLLWRLEGIGVHLKSVRNLAVQYHLWHKASWSDQSKNKALMYQRQAENQYVCKNGIRKL